MNDCRPIIDMSTPERLEKTFHSWLFSRADDETSIIDVDNGLGPVENINFVPQSEMNFVYPQYCSYVESSESGSPSSLSCSSMDFEIPPPPKPERDILRNSGYVSNRKWTPDMLAAGRNQLGRTYSPGLPLSMFEREEIVKLFQNGWKICDISKRLCVTHSCVSKILNRYRTTGSVKPKDAKEGRTESPLVLAIRDYRSRLGIQRQSEIREQLIKDGICTKETAPSRSSINHILRTKLDIKKRKKTDD